MPGKAGKKKQILFDTSMIIGYLRGKSECKSAVDAVRTGKIIGFISSITIFELYTGAFLSSDTAEGLRDVREILSWFQPPIVLDDSIAQKSAYLYGQLRKKNQLIELNDLFIASTAIITGLPVQTLNLSHFKRVPGLKLIE